MTQIYLHYVSQEEYDRVAKEEPEKLPFCRVRPACLNRDYVVSYDPSSTSEILKRERERKHIKKQKRLNK